MNRPTALLCAFAAVAIWGSNAVIIRHLVREDVTASAIAFLRVLIGGVVLIPWILTHRVESTGIRSRHPWLWIGIACYCGNMLVFHAALSHANAASVMLLENTAPAVTLFGAAALFKERITVRAIGSLLLAGVGVMLICGLDSKAYISGYGILFGVSSGITWGGYMLSCQGRGDSAQKSKEQASSLCFTLLCSSLGLLPLALTSEVTWPHTLYTWGLVIVLGVVHTALATILWEKAIAELRAYTASILFLLTIVITFALAEIFLDESVTSVMVLGGTAIALSALAATTKKNGMHSRP